MSEQSRVREVYHTVQSDAFLAGLKEHRVPNVITISGASKSS